MENNIPNRLEPLLEKAIKPSGPPSVPTVLSGRIGIWRNIRGNRMFIELKGAAFRGITEEALKSMSVEERERKFSRYFDERGILKPESRQAMQQGKILAGPADIVGKSIDNLSSTDWETLTPWKTKEEFSRLRVANNGVAALKSSVRRAIDNPGDSRIIRLQTANTVDQLVPIARVSGFTTDEIKRVLSSGKVSTKVVPDLSTGGGIDLGPDAESPIDSGNLKSILSTLSSLPAGDEFRAKIRELAQQVDTRDDKETLSDIAQEASEAFRAEIVRRGGTPTDPSRAPRLLPEDFDIKPKFERLPENRQLTRESLDSDRKAIQKTISEIQSDDALDQLVKELKIEADTPEEARVEALIHSLGTLEDTLRVPQLKREARRIHKNVINKRLTRAEAMIALLALLRLLLTLVIIA